MKAMILNCHQLLLAKNSNFDHRGLELYYKPTQKLTTFYLLQNGAIKILLCISESEIYLNICIEIRNNTAFKAVMMVTLLQYLLENTLI